MSRPDYQSKSALQLIQRWYLNECNGDWEHSFGVRIETLDNPGWLVTIDLIETRWEPLSVERKILQEDEVDWIQYEVRDGKFIGCGGPHNLEKILTMFLQLIDFESTAG